MIPARKGSKGVKDINIRLLCGVPLISYSITTALDFRSIDDVFLNSDSNDFLEIGEKWGAKTYKRPEQLGSDETQMLQVIKDFIKNLEKIGKQYDAIIALYPVYQLRNGNDLEHMTNIFESNGGDRPLIGFKVPKTHPYLS